MLHEWARRLVLAYLVVYYLELPFGMLPLTDPVANAVRAVKALVLGAISRLMFGIEPTAAMTGSGDTTDDYLRLVATVALALVAATAWHAAARGAPVSARTKDLLMVGARYVLGAIMLGYGWAKLIPTQMPMPGPERLLTPIGDTSPMGLLWTLMGASPAYQMFAGFGEAVGGVLLFWRRTTLLGALIVAGVMTNVVALNFCYDVPVKLFSTHLLLTALLIVAPHASRLADVLWRNRPAPAAELRPFPLTRGWARWTALAVKAVLIVNLVAMPILTSYRLAQRYGFLAPAHALHGTYAVTSFTRGDGGPVGDAERWVRVAIDGRMGRAAIQRASGRIGRLPLTLDEREATLTLVESRHAAPVVLRYRVTEPGHVRVEGTFESAPIVALLRKEPDGLLLSRGFHWINETPFSR